MAERTICNCIVRAARSPTRRFLAHHLVFVRTAILFPSRRCLICDSLRGGQIRTTSAAASAVLLAGPASCTAAPLTGGWRHKPSRLWPRCRLCRDYSARSPVARRHRSAQHRCPAETKGRAGSDERIVSAALPKKRLFGSLIGMTGFHARA